GEVVERRKELAVSQVPGRAEDHQCRGVNWQPLETLDERVLEHVDVSLRLLRSMLEGAGARPRQVDLLRALPLHSSSHPPCSSPPSRSVSALTPATGSPSSFT